jgi:hypothetical protein
LVAPLGNRASLRRLLDRFGFGARPGELDAAVAAGFAATADALLQPPAADPGVLATPRPDLGPEPTPPGKQDTAAKAAYAKQLSAQANTLIGTAGPVFLIGSGVQGGFYGEEPSLTDLDDGDLKESTDFRSIYATLLAKVLDTDPGRVLGNYTGRLDNVLSA